MTASVRPMPTIRAVLPAALALALAVGLGAGGDDDEPATTASVPATTEAETQTEAETSEQANGDGGDQQEEPQRQEQLERPLEVEDVLAAVLTGSGSPEQACDELVTDAFVRDAYGGRANCLAAREQGGVAREIAVEDVAESGDTATASAVPKGGPYDGVTVEVELVADPDLEGAWLVDSLFADVPAGP